MAIEKEILDRLLADYKNPGGENGVLRQLTKALMERALEAEMATHLGYEKHEPAAPASADRRNGKSKQTLKGEFGEIEITTPRDREATFEPRIIGKGQTRMAGSDTNLCLLGLRHEWALDQPLPSGSRQAKAGLKFKILRFLVTANS